VNIGRVSQATAETGAAVVQMLSAAAYLSRRPNKLPTEGGSFIADFSAA
jgi:hypothetical protein